MKMKFVWLLVAEVDVEFWMLDGWKKKIGIFPILHFGTFWYVFYHFKQHQATTATNEVIVVEHPLYHRWLIWEFSSHMDTHEYISDIWYAVLLIFIQPNLYLSNSVEHPFIYLNSSILPVQYNSIYSTLYYIKTYNHSHFRPQKLIWHGSHTQGERALDSYCDGWTKATSDKIGIASSLLGNKLLDQERYSCDNRFVVLCIEVLSENRRKKRDVER